MARMTNFRSAAIATGNAVNDSAYDNITEFVKLYKTDPSLSSSFSGIELTNTDMDTITVGGRYYVTGTVNTNLPIGTDVGYLNVVTNKTTVMQIFIGSRSNLYTRSFDKYALSWTVWRSTSKDIDELVDQFNSRTNISYGHGLPQDNVINPPNGTNAIYMDLDTDISWICKDATPGANVWVPSSGGQFLGNSKVGSVMFSSQTTSENLVLPDGQNGLVFDNITVEGLGSITIEGSAVLVTV